MGSANERWRYNETSSLTGWACTQNDPWSGLELFNKWMGLDTDYGITILEIYVVEGITIPEIYYCNILLPLTLYNMDK